MPVPSYRAPAGSTNLALSPSREFHRKLAGNVVKTQGRLGQPVDEAFLHLARTLLA